MSKNTKGKPIPTKKQSEKIPGKNPDTGKTAIEIVPGKFFESDWNAMLDVDSSQEFIWELIDEIIDNTDKILYERYIERQTIPYTINEAKQAILHLIDWQFLPCEKDGDFNERFIEDDEPTPTIIDSWAQGYVQSYLEDNEVVLTDKEETNASDAERNTFLEELNYMISPKEQFACSLGTQIEDIESEMKIPSSLDRPKVDGIIPSKSKEPTKKNLFTLSKNATMNKSILNNQFTNSFLSSDSYEKSKSKARPVESENKKLEEYIMKAPNACHAILKSYLGRPAGYRELEIDPEGNVITIAKIDADNLPSSKIKPRFTVSDVVKPEPVKIKTRKHGKKLLTDDELFEKFKNKIETDEYDNVLEPTHGVVFKMGKITRIGPKKGTTATKQQLLLQKTESFLKPIRSNATIDDNVLNRETIDRILESQIETETVRPLSKLKPIPPIASSMSVN